MSASYTPVRNYILAEQSDAEEISRGGIVIASQRMKDFSVAKALKVGPGEYISGEWVQSTLKPGETFFYNPAAAIEIPQTSLRLIPWGAVFAVVEEV